MQKLTSAAIKTQLSIAASMSAGSRRKACPRQTRWARMVPSSAAHAVWQFHACQMKNQKRCVEACQAPRMSSDYSSPEGYRRLGAAVSDMPHAKCRGCGHALISTRGLPHARCNCTRNGAGEKAARRLRRARTTLWTWEPSARTRQRWLASRTGGPCCTACKCSSCWPGPCCIASAISRRPARSNWCDPRSPPRIK